MRRLSFLLLFALLPLAAGAQDDRVQGMPREVYYLMPEFGQGLIYFDNMAPARGLLNISAVDHTLRFMDRDGKEKVSSDDSHIVRVQIDSAVFVHDLGVYYRLYPVSPEVSLAVRREVQVLRDAKQGAYGMNSRTSSIKEYTSVSADGVVYSLDRDREYPYEVSETLFLYCDRGIVAFNKKQLRKCFPEYREAIDAWLQEHFLPKTLSEALETVSAIVQ